MKVFVVCFLAVLLGTAHGLFNRYVYEFGQDYGYILQEIYGTIPLLHKLTEKNISVPPYYTITYIRVTVDALSPPKVDFNAANNIVTINYSLTQIASSKYSIVVKGVIAQ